MNFANVWMKARSNQLQSPRGSEANPWADVSPIPETRMPPDGKILAERVGQTIILRDSATGALLRVLRCEKEWWEWAKQTDALAFTPDSTKLIAADLRNNIHVWDVATGKELQKFTGHRGRIFSVSVSSDGRMFAPASEDSTVLIWQLDGG